MFRQICEEDTKERKIELARHIVEEGFVEEFDDSEVFFMCYILGTSEKVEDVEACIFLWNHTHAAHDRDLPWHHFTLQFYTQLKVLRNFGRYPHQEETLEKIEKSGI